MDWKKTLFTAVNSEFLSPFPVDLEEQVEIRIRVWKDSPIEQIFLRTCPEGEAVFFPLELVETQAFFAIYATQVSLKWACFRYRFLVTTKEGQSFWFNQRTVSQSNPLDHFDFQLLVGYRSVEWVQDSIFYQIFPDRFHNGNPQLNYQTGEYSYFGHPIAVKAWGESPKEKAGEWNPAIFFNGDLEGIRQKLDHLETLGVNAIYLNPIFHSQSNHRYDVIDYKKIDPHLGDESDLIRLVEEVHHRGMKIILDGVFNHTGSGHRWFNREKLFEESGAYQDAESEYAQFYTFHTHPESYESWLGVDGLPKLNYRSETLRDLVYRGKDSIVRYWLEKPFDLDGWRFDVANMQARQGVYQENRAMWKEVRGSIKPDFSDRYLMGEHFFDGTDLLQGDTLDGIMNYQGFYFPLFQWLNGHLDFGSIAGGKRVSAPLSAIDCVEQIQDMMARLPWQVALQMYNGINSHDRPRFLTEMGENFEMQKAALVVLFAFPGAPSVYYGDEIGLLGGGDPDCRRCMVWNESEWNHEIYSFYQRLIAFRKKSNALKHGALKWLYTDANTMVFARLRTDETQLIVSTRTPDAEPLQLSLWELGIEEGIAHFWDGNRQHSICQSIITLPQDNGFWDLKPS